MCALPMASPGEAGVHVYVGMTKPTKIAIVTPEWLDLFGLEAKACLGRTLNVLVGPETDIGKISNVIELVRNGWSSTVRIVLYTSRGDKGLYAVSGKQERSVHGENHLCRLSMIRSDAVPYKLAAADNGECKLLVEALKPFKIVTCSPLFEQKFGITQREALNRSLHIIQGPDTDFIKWNALFDAALAGRSQQSVMHLYLRDGKRVTDNMRLTPVLGQCEVQFVAVTIGDESSSADGCVAATRRPSVSVRDLRRPSAEFQRRPSAEYQRRPSAEAAQAFECAPSEALRRKDSLSTPPRKVAAITRSSPISSVASERAISRSSPDTPVAAERQADRGTSMGAVKQLIELRTRARQQVRAKKAKADMLSAAQASSSENHSQILTLSLSGGILSFLTSLKKLIMMVLVSLNLASPSESAEQIKFNMQRADPSSYRQSWMRIHDLGDE